RASLHLLVGGLVLVPGRVAHLRPPLPGDEVGPRRERLASADDRQLEVGDLRAVGGALAGPGLGEQPLGRIGDGGGHVLTRVGVHPGGDIVVAGDVDVEEALPAGVPEPADHVAGPWLGVDHRIGTVQVVVHALDAVLAGQVRLGAERGRDVVHDAEQLADAVLAGRLGDPGEGVVATAAAVQGGRATAVPLRQHDTAEATALVVDRGVAPRREAVGEGAGDPIAEPAGL